MVLLFVLVRGKFTQWVLLTASYTWLEKYINKSRMQFPIWGELPRGHLHWHMGGAGDQGGHSPAPSSCWQGQGYPTPRGQHGFGLGHTQGKEKWESWNKPKKYMENIPCLA